MSGWFGGQVVIDRSAIGLPPVLLDATGREAPLELEAGISVVADGRGDVQFVGSDLVRCLTGWRLGLEPHNGEARCPDDAVMAVSPQGRWAVTRDLRWLDRSTGRSIQLTGRPFRWPVDSVDFVDGRHALVAVDISGRSLKLMCSQRDGCARLS